MAGEVSSPGARQRQRQLRPAWYSTPVDKNKGTNAAAYNRRNIFDARSRARRIDREMKENSADDGDRCWNGGIKRGDEERRQGERRKSEEKRRNREERMIEKKRNEKEETEGERKRDASLGSEEVDEQATVLLVEGREDRGEGEGAGCSNERNLHDFACFSAPRRCAHRVSAVCLRFLLAFLATAWPARGC